MAKKATTEKKKIRTKALYLGDLTPEQVLKAMLQVKPPKGKKKRPTRP